MCVLRTEGYVPFRTRASVHSSGAAGALGSALPTALRLLEAEENSGRPSCDFTCGSTGAKASWDFEALKLFGKHPLYLESITAVY